MYVDIFTLNLIIYIFYAKEVIEKNKVTLHSLFYKKVRKLYVFNF